MFDFGRDTLIAWVVGLVVLLPLLTILLGEAQTAAARRRSPWGRVVGLLQNTVVPFAGLYVLLRFVADVPDAHLAVKAALTVLAVTVLNTVLVAFNLMAIRVGGERQAPRLVLDLIRIILVLIGAAITISTVWEVDLSGLLAALGVGSVVIGLALQDTLSGLFAGLSLMSSQHFKIGDFIRVGDKEGRVTGMDWRSVSVTLDSNEVLIVPNTELAKQNFSVLGQKGAPIATDIALTFSYQHAPASVVAALDACIRSVAQAHDGTTGNSEIQTFSAEGVVYKTSLFAPDFERLQAARASFMTMVWYHMQRHDLVMPGRHNQDFAHEHADGQIGATAQDRAQLLAKAEFLGRPAAQLQALGALAQVKRYQQQEIIQRSGASIERLEVLIAGAAAMGVRGKSGFKSMQTLSTGEFLCVRALLTGAMSPVELQAETPCITLAIPVEEFRQFLDIDLAAARAIDERMDTTERLIHSHRER